MIDPVEVNEIFARSLNESGLCIECIVTRAKLQVSDEDRICIEKVLRQLPAPFIDEGGWSFLNLCMDREGNQWTGSHQTMEQLMMLGMATGMVKILFPRDLWSILPGGVPYFTIVIS